MRMFIPKPLLRPLERLELKDVQIGQYYLICQLRDEHTGAPFKFTYVAAFAQYHLNLWDIHEIYSIIHSSALISQKNKIIERAKERAIAMERDMINNVLRGIIGDPHFKFY